MKFYYDNYDDAKVSSVIRQRIKLLAILGRAPVYIGNVRLRLNNYIKEERTYIQCAKYTNHIALSGAYINKRISLRIYQHLEHMHGWGTSVPLNPWICSHGKFS